MPFENLLHMLHFFLKPCPAGPKVSENIRSPIYSEKWFIFNCSNNRTCTIRIETWPLTLKQEGVTMTRYRHSWELVRHRRKPSLEWRSGEMCQEWNVG